MSTEQQAAYWEQWNQYYAQYYQQGPEAQQYAAYQQPQQYQVADTANSGIKLFVPFATCS